MLPVLFHIAVPAPFAKPAAIAVALAIVLFRAWAYARREGGAGAPAKWVAAVRGDGSVIVILGALVAAAWKGGFLDGDVDVPVHTYGLLIATAFLAGAWLAQREGRRQGQDAERIADLAFWVLVAALVGSRVYFMLVNWRDYFTPASWLVATPFGRIPRVLAVWEGGLVFYGGFIGAALTAAWIMRRHGMRFLPYADTMIPSVALGHFLGRLGCFAAGCCWGDVCRSGVPWAVKFPEESLAYQTFAGRANPGAFLAAAGHTTLPLHPTQLYEAFGELAIFAVLVLWVRPRKRFHGEVLATWLALYAVLRTVVELFRGDVERGVYFGLGAGQWTSIAIFAAGAAMWLRARRGGAPVAPAAGAPA
ncbi:MAG TPA: prolipoprotein diacylglyceryl transferase [Anaeromyxobacteraceae bacterium]|nr:prolipoprotein diacylglyceryl transferase [Anaeromyxobacteraceae bacterium]